MRNWSTKTLADVYRRRGEDPTRAAGEGERDRTVILEGRARGRAAEPKEHKYGARKEVVDGIKFDSRAEARAYQTLKIMLATGEIEDLKLQPRYELQEAFIDAQGKAHRAIEYRADFYFVRRGVRVVVDVKGFRTAEYLLKRKLFLYRHRYVVFEEWK